MNQSVAKLQNFEALLKKGGYKVTKARLAILNILGKIKSPIDVQGVYGQLQKTKEGKQIDKVTVYRTLSDLEKGGIVKKVNLRKGAAYYEFSAGHHHHIVCTDCGITEDFELCDMDSLTKKIVSRASNFRSVSEHALELFGLCNSCVKN